MIAPTIFVLVSAWAQLTPAPAMPEIDGTTVFVDMKNGDSFYGIQDGEPAERNGIKIYRFKEDGPFASPSLRTVRSDEAKFPLSPERASMRKERWEREYAENNYKRTTLASGEEVWLPAGEVTLAERARALAVGVQQQMADPGPVPDAAGEEAVLSQKQTEQLPFVRQWGPHLGIGLGAALLMGLVLKFFVFAESD